MFPGPVDLQMHPNEQRAKQWSLNRCCREQRVSRWAPVIGGVTWEDSVHLNRLLRCNGLHYSCSFLARVSRIFAIVMALSPCENDGPVSCNRIGSAHTCRIMIKPHTLITALLLMERVFTLTECRNGWEVHCCFLLGGNQSESASNLKRPWDLRDWHVQRMELVCGKIQEKRNW